MCTSVCQAFSGKQGSPGFSSVANFQAILQATKLVCGNCACFSTTSPQKHSQIPISRTAAAVILDCSFAKPLIRIST